MSLEEYITKNRKTARYFTNGFLGGCIRDTDFHSLHHWSFDTVRKKYYVSYEFLIL